MKRARSLPAVFLISAALAAAMPLRGGHGAEARRLTADTAPSAVTVYADRASISRTGSVDLPAGDSVVVVDRLPAGVIASSLTAKGRSAGKVTIGSVDFVTEFNASEETNRRMADLRAKLRDIGDQISAIDAKVAGFTAEQTMIAGIASSFGTEVPAAGDQSGALAGGGSPAAIVRRQPSRLAISPDAWKSAWSAVRDGATDAAEALRKTAIDRRALEERQAALQNQLDALGSGDGPNRSRSVEIAVHADQAAQLQLQLDYDLPGAGWEPIYEARLDSASGELVLREQAMVTQSTGEDWKDVKLTLSTVRPSGNVRPPELYPRTISLRPPFIAQPMAAQEETNAAKMQTRDFAMAAAPPPPAPPAMAAPVPRPYIPPPEVQINTAIVSTSSFAVDYAIPGTSIVRGDNTPQKVQIDETKSKSSLSILAEPAFDRRAYIEAKAKNTAPHPFLPGKTSLYLDGNFVGETRLPTLRPGEEATLPFGTDDKIKISYQADPQIKSKEGFISHETVTKRSALMTIANRHEISIEITVLGQLPVSEDKDLKVDIVTDTEPTTENYDDKKGIVAWTAQYKPDESRKIRFGYTVTAPADRIVDGLGE